MRSRLTTLALLLAGLAAVLAACGGGGGGGGDPAAKDLLATAFEKTIPSADVTIDARLDIKGLAGFHGPLVVHVSGPFHDNGPGKLPGLDLQASIGSGGSSLPLGLTTTDKNVWLTLQGQSYELGEAQVARINRQLRQDERQRKQQGLARLGIDPRSWIANARDEGDATVAGERTTHVSGDLDIGRMLDDLDSALRKAPASLGGASRPQPLTDAQKRDIERIVRDPRIDVYAAKSDHSLRRISVDLDFEVPKDERARVNGIESGSLSFDMELAHVGSARPITPPRKALPLSDLQSQIAALSGAGSAGGETGVAPGSGAGPSASSPSAEDFRRYTDCLRKAGPSNAEALARCSQILNGA